MTREITVDEMPRQILEAAHQVEAYFVDRGVLCWALGGLQSRVKGGAPAAGESRVVLATHVDLYRTLKNLPEHSGEAIDAALLQMAAICAGEKTLRLWIPNGRTLRVTLE